MSWTIVCDLTMSDYQDSMVIDKTHFKNNARISGPVERHSGFVRFLGPDSQLEIPADTDSLNRFFALRIQAFVRPHPIAHRYNIVEGWMSFALFIESDGRLMGTIFDGNKWKGPDSKGRTVPANQWSRICMEYDGVGIVSLKLNGKVVGSIFDAPYKIFPPRQVIAIGHWPKGDGRYTFSGDLGHIRIERRDYEDIWRDTINTLYCRRRLNPDQLRARREMEYLLSTLPPDEQKKLQECSRKQLELLRKLIHRLRGQNPKETAIMRRIGRMLINAWCCAMDIDETRRLIRAFFRSLQKHPGDTRSLEALLDEFLQISYQCTRKGHPYDRIRELFFVIFPELRNFELSLRQIIKTL